MTPPIVDCDQVHAGLAAPDLEAALDFYLHKLGFQLGFKWGDPVTFAGVNLGKVQMFLAEGTPTPSRDTAAVFFKVGDADALHDFHVANGVTIAEPIGDRPYGIRDYSVRDLNGYWLTFGHHIFNLEEPLVIERVDVHARIEKRLAALLEDLARHKRMTVGSCLEEMILHTNEGVGPHTAATLRHIQTLKAKHGIDYDVHASYGFTENPAD